MSNKKFTKADLEKAFNDGKRYGDNELPLINEYDFSNTNLTAFDVWFEAFKIINNKAEEQSLNHPKG